MKVVVFLALIAAAAALPQYFYPTNAKTVPSPLTYGYPTAVTSFPHTYSPYSYPYGFPYNFPVVPTAVVRPDQSTRTKRSADAAPDADADADPYIFTTGQSPYPFPGTTTYNYPTYPGFTPYSSNPIPYTYPTTYGFPYTFPGVPSAVVQRSKRSADATPDADADADPFIFTTGQSPYPFPGTTTYNYPTYPGFTPYSANPMPYTYPTTYGFPYAGYTPYAKVVKTA